MQAKEAERLRLQGRAARGLGLAEEEGLGRGLQWEPLPSRPEFAPQRVPTLTFGRTSPLSSWIFPASPSISCVSSHCLSLGSLSLHYPFQRLRRPALSSSF